MREHMEGQVWKVGQLAAATGLTVRTLHHYDHIGLVRPAGRTRSDHRLYTEAEVRRLYQVLALRQLGLPLDVVGSVVTGSTSMAEVLMAHQDYLDQQLAKTRLLRPSGHLGHECAANAASICRELPRTHPKGDRDGQHRTKVFQRRAIGHPRRTARAAWPRSDRRCRGRLTRPPVARHRGRRAGNGPG